jgi:hypothetical protein
MKKSFVQVLRLGKAAELRSSLPRFVPWAWKDSWSSRNEIKRTNGTVTN